MSRDAVVVVLALLVLDGTLNKKRAELLLAATDEELTGEKLDFQTIDEVLEKLQGYEI